MYKSPMYFVVSKVSYVIRYPTMHEIGLEFLTGGTILKDYWNRVKQKEKCNKTFEPNWNGIQGKRMKEERCFQFHKCEMHRMELYREIERDLWE